MGSSDQPLTDVQKGAIIEACIHRGGSFSLHTIVQDPEVSEAFSKVSYKDLVDIVRAYLLVMEKEGVLTRTGAFWWRNTQQEEL